ncbi:patatin-like phospholipase family protein, partial [Thermanaerothrix sp.]
MSEVVLALGGGGVKGIAHLGVIHRLEQEGIKIKAIAGTSAGG